MGVNSLTHALCESCWQRRNPDKYLEDVARLKHRYREVCCDCGYPTESGIYVRGQERKYSCGGTTGFHLT